jgi:transcriptional regulator with XRE-family HTH domain
MSYFATELEALIIEKKINSGAELSKISGVDQATLSRVRSGTQQISHQDLDKIAHTFGPSSAIHARLLAARLREELRPPGGGLIEIDVRDSEQPKIREQANSYGTKLTPKLQRIFGILAKHVEETELRNILTNLANLYEKGSLS